MEFNQENYQKVLNYIEHISVEKNIEKAKIIAISKNHPQSSVLQAIKAGVQAFGENKVQEAENKFLSLKRKFNQLELHLTGPLQTNKVKKALSLFNYFHTLDREKLAKEFYKHIKNNTMLEKKYFFIQVNTGLEKQKSGIDPKDLNQFINYCKNEINLNIVGLMCIPPIDQNPEQHFEMLLDLSQKNNLKYLSMGMTNDYKEALSSRATHLRLGTILFGRR